MEGLLFNFKERMRMKCIAYFKLPSLCVQKHRLCVETTSGQNLQVLCVRLGGGGRTLLRTSRYRV